MIFPMLPIFTALNTVLAEEEAEKQAEKATEREEVYKTTCADTYKKEKIPFGVCMVDIPNKLYCNIPNTIYCNITER